MKLLLDGLALMFDSGFEPDIIPGAMLAQRIMGIMAHWREYMRKSIILDCRAFLTRAVNRGKLFRPSHIYTGRATSSNVGVPKM